MLSVVGFTAPHIDYHALAPEIIVATTLLVVLLVDLASERNRALLGTISGIGLLAAMVPILTLAVDGTDRFVLSGNPGYVVDNFALTMKALFIVAGYIVVLLSTNTIAEGDYWEGEYYILILSSVLGMTIMASARDLIGIFIALELLSIPAYMLAAWKKRDMKGNEAGIKYYLMGVFASAVMLYGMSLIYGFTGTTVLADIGTKLSGDLGDGAQLVTLGILFVLIGFGFKVSAVPFHSWAPDTYEGAPTPVTAFLATASRAAGFMPLLELIFVAFYPRHDVYEPLMWALAAATMTIGNLIALRQTNLVRMLAYSGIAQAGYILAPFAVAGTSVVAGETALKAIVTYLVIYVVMNLGAFAVVIAVARKTRSAEITSFGGLFHYAPGLTVAMSIFLFSLAGIPPLGGWFAKLVIFGSLASAGTTSGYVMAVLVAVNSVIAFFYYARVMRYMWMEESPDGDETPIRIPASLQIALVLTVGITLIYGVFPGLVSHFTDSVSLLSLGR